MHINLQRQKMHAPHKTKLGIRGSGAAGKFAAEARCQRFELKQALMETGVGGAVIVGRDDVSD